MSKFINNIVYYVFLILSFGITMSCVYATMNLIDGIMRFAILAVIGVFFIVLLLFADKMKNGYSKITDKLSAKKMLIILLVLAVVTKIGAIVVFQINSQIHPDIKLYISYAQQFTNNGYISDAWSYAYKGPKAVIFGIILSPVFKLFGTTPVAFSAYIAIWQIICVGLVFSTLNYVFNKKMAFLSVLIWIFLPTEIFLPQYIVHEQFLLFTIVITVWLYFRVIPALNKVWAKVLLFIVGAVVISVGTVVNMIGLIAVVAICIVLISKWFAGTKNIKNGVALLLAVVTLVISVVAIPSGLSKYSRSITYKDDSVNIVLEKNLWSYYVGLSEETGGSFNMDDIKVYKANDDKMTPDEIVEYRQQLYSERVKDLISHPDRLASLMWIKFNKVWGATKYTLDYSNETILNPTMQHLYNSYLFKPLSLINSLALCGLSFMLFLSMFKNKRFKKNWLLQFLMMFMIGFTLIFLVVESSTKYVCCFKVYFIITAVAGMSQFANISAKITSHFRKKKERITDKTEN